MKKSALLLTFMFLLFVLSGCVQWKTNIVIHSNGSVEVTQLLGMTKEMQALASESESSDPLFSKERQEELKKKGYEVQGYKDGNFSGYKVKKNFSNLEEMVTSELFEETDQSQMSNNFNVKVDKGFFKNKITIKGEIDLTNKEEASQEDGFESLANMMLSSVDLGMSITLPIEAKSNNADYVDGKTYSWDFTINEKNPIELEVETWNFVNIFMIIGLLVLLLILGLFLTRKKNKKTHSS